MIPQRAIWRVKVWEGPRLCYRRTTCLVIIQTIVNHFHVLGFINLNIDTSSLARNRDTLRTERISVSAANSRPGVLFQQMSLILSSTCKIQGLKQLPIELVAVVVEGIRWLRDMPQSVVPRDARPSRLRFYYQSPVHCLQQEVTSGIINVCSAVLLCLCLCLSLARSKTQFDMIKNYLYIVKRTAEKRKDDEKAHRFLTLDTDFIDTNRIHSNALKRLLTPGDSPKEKHEYLSKEEMQGFNPRFVKDLHPEKRDVVNLTLNLSQMNDLKESSLKNFVIQSQITRENPYDDLNQRRLRQLTVKDPSNVQPLYQATDAMVKELSHIKNNPYNQEYWQVHNSRVEDLLEGMQNQSKIDTLRDNASAYLSTVNTQRMQAEDFIIKNSSYRNKEIKKLERLAAKKYIHRRDISVIQRLFHQIFIIKEQKHECN